MSTILEQKLNLILNEKQAKILPENLKKGVSFFDIEGTAETGGTDTSDATIKPEDVIKGKIGYGKDGRIEGTLEPAKVLMFKSKEEMLNTRNVDVNTIGVVTDTKPIQIELNTKIKNIYLPKQIVMETPVTITDEKGFRLVSADNNYNGLDVYYSKTRLSINYGSNNHDDMMNCSYQSTDGITYTQQYVNGGTMYNCYWPKESVLVTRYLDSNTENEYEPTEFEKSLLRTLDIYYDDAYQYMSTKDREYMTGIKSIKLNEDGTSGVVDETVSVFEPLLDAFIPDIVKQMKCYYGMGVTIFRNDNNEYLLGSGSGNTYNVIYKNGKWYIRAEGDGNKPYYYTTLNFDTFKCNEPILCRKDFTFTKTFSNSSQTVYYFMELDGYYPVAQLQIMSDGSYETNWEHLDGTYFPTDDTSVEKQYNVNDDQFGHVEFLGWHRLLKNSNLQYPYELLDDISAYGEHGLIKGNGSILEHLDILGYINKYKETNILYGETNAGGKYVNVQECNTIEQFQNSKIIELSKNILGNTKNVVGPYIYTLQNIENDSVKNNIGIFRLYNTNGELITERNITYYNTPVVKYKNDILYVGNSIKIERNNYNNFKITLTKYNVIDNNWEDIELVSANERAYLTLYVDNNNKIYYGTSSYDYKGTIKIYKNDTILFTFTPSVADRNLTILNVDNEYVYILYGTDGNQKLKISKFTLSGIETILASATYATIGINTKYVSYLEIINSVQIPHTAVIENGTITDISNLDLATRGNFVGKNDFQVVIKNNKYYIFDIGNGLYNAETKKLYVLKNIDISYNNRVYIVENVLIAFNENKLDVIRPDLVFTDSGNIFIIPVMGKNNNCIQAYIQCSDIMNMSSIGPITQAEYDQALDTATQIKGE